MAEPARNVTAMFAKYLADEGSDLRHEYINGDVAGSWLLVEDTLAMRATA